MAHFDALKWPTPASPEHPADEAGREVRSSLVYRYLVRLYFEPVPDGETLIRLSNVIGVEGIRGNHRAVG